MYFILSRCCNIFLHAILSVFTLNLTENDRPASDFIRELYNKQQAHTFSVIY